ncbi:nuclear transport factor 2 family protein [Aliiglaciecola sp. M165]|nr:nuclear transport factor 2 family protein [Aliiglaciecola sp. M165]
MKILLAIALIFNTFSACAEQLSLQEKMLSLDNAAFDSFNRCEDPKMLKKHATYFAPDVEFYHDNGGVTWDRETMLENTQKHACGKFTRKLLPNTFQVSPIRGFGAITEGVHVFCQTSSQKCEGKAKFVMVWRDTEGTWEVTRVLSYGHQAHTDN